MKRAIAVLTFGVALLAGVGGTVGWTAEQEVVAVGNPSVAQVPFFNLDRFAAKHGVKVLIRRMGTFTQAQQAVELGAADVGALGYVSLIQMAVAGGTPKAKVVSGSFVGSQDVVFHKDVKIARWKDVEGKTIARIPGSFAEFLFRVAATHNGVDLSKVRFKDFGFSYATLNLALKRKEVDGLVIWSPGLDMPVVDGFGYFPPISVNDTPMGNINGVLAMNATFLQKSPSAAEKVLRGFVDAIRHFSANPEELVKGARAITGADPSILRESIKHAKLTIQMYEEKAKALAKVAFQEKLVKKDASGVIGQWMDYGLLMKVTGKGRKELGG